MEPYLPLQTELHAPERRLRELSGPHGEPDLCVDKPQLCQVVALQLQGLVEMRPVSGEGIPAAERNLHLDEAP